MNDVDRIRQMVEDGQITSEEAEHLIAVLREVDAAGERLAAAGSAARSGASTSDDLTEADEEKLDAAFDRAFEEYYQSELNAQRPDESPAPTAAQAPPAAPMGPAQATPQAPQPGSAPHAQEPGPGPQAQEPAPAAQAPSPAPQTSPQPPPSSTSPPTPPPQAEHAPAEDTAARGGDVASDPFAQAEKTMDETMAHHASMKAAYEAHTRAREISRDAVQQAREAAREAARQGRDAARDAMRTARDAAREAAREARRASRDAARTSRDAARSVAAEVRAATDQPNDSSRPGAKVAPDHVKWLTVEMLAGELEVVTVPGLTAPTAEGGPGHFDITQTDDGYRIQFMPDRGSFIDRIVTSLKSGELKVQVPPDYGLNVMATAGEVTTSGVRYLRGRMRAGEMTADVLEGVDFGMTAGEFTATLDLRRGTHMVTLGAGDLNVTLSESADVTVRGRVSIGDVESHVQGLQRSGSGLGGSVDGTIGTGEALLDLRVTTGDMDIASRRGRHG